MRALLTALTAAVIGGGIALAASATAGTPPYVGFSGEIGPAAVTDWSMSVDSAAHVVTVTGEVTNRSDITLVNTRVTLWAEWKGDTDTVFVSPAILRPGESGTFTGWLYTGKDLIVRLEVQADLGYDFAATIP